VSGIRQAAVRERVGHQEIAEFIVDAGRGNWKHRQKRNANGNHANEKSRHREGAAAAHI